jgi:PAS domain S-box-containing protein
MKRDATGKFISNWNSERKQRVSVSLTKTAWRSLDQEAHKRGISRSEVIERFARTLEGEQFLDAQINGADAQINSLQQQILEHQQALKALQHQKQELEALTECKVAIILESITDAFVAFDQDWRYTYVNQAAAQILHKTPEELLGKHVWNEVFPELVGKIPYQALHRAVTEQVPVSWEEFGESVQRWIEANAYPSTAGVAVYFRDVTDRKQAEAERKQLLHELELEHARFEAVLRQMPAGVMIADATTDKLVLANEQAQQIIGYGYEQSLELEDYAPIISFEAFRSSGHVYAPHEYPLVRSLNTGEVVTNEQMTIHREDGSRIFINVNSAPILDNQGQIVAAVVIFQDVTDYKQVEQALRESEERLRLALTGTQTVVWDMDLKTNRVVCSANALEVWSVQEGTAEDFFALIHPDDRQQMIQAAQRAITGEEHSYAQEYRVISPDGLVRWINSQGRVYLDEAGRGDRMIGVSVDITERKQIEAERDRLLEREQTARLEAETERKRLYDILMQLPAMIGIVKGSDLVYEFASPSYLQVTGRTLDMIGKSMREVFPELEGQIYFDAIKHVYQTGETFIRNESLAYWDRNGDGVLEEGFFNCICPPWRDAKGTIQGVLIYNIEVTAQVQARQKIEELLTELQQKEKQQQFLIELNDAIRAIQDSKEIMWQVVCSTGQHFGVTRCTYGEVDSTQEYVIVEQDYCNGVISIVGSHQMDAFGPELIAELKQGKTIVVDDVDTDPRTATSGEAAFDAIQTKSLLCVPLVKEGRFVALLVLHHISPRQWTEEEVAMMERIAQKTWLAVERSRVEQELRESEAHLQLAVKIGRMGTWDWEMQTGALLWSEGHFAVLGLQPLECEPSYEVWASHVHPDDLAEVEAKLQQAIAAKKEYHHEYRLCWLDGSIHWVEVRGQFTYDAQGNPKHSIGAVIDITERKQAEQEREQLLERERLARSEAEAAQHQLATIFDTSPVGLALLDEKQRFIAINEALAEINGLTREQHLRHSISELFGQSDPKLVEVFNQIYTTGNPFISPNFAVNVPGRHDRRPGYYNVYYLPTVNSNSQVEGVLVYVVDVTERVQLELAQRFLSQASAVLASSLDYQTTLERVAQLTVPELADWCTVHMIEEDGAIEQIAVAHIDPAKLEWAYQIRDKYPLNPDDPRGAAYTLRTGQPDFVPEIPDELLVQAARDSEHLEILRQVGFSSVMTVPLRTQSRILGVISFICAESGRQYAQADLQLAEEVARRASLAIDNAQLYRVAQRDRAKAEAANRIKDEFLAVLSHELRSPLNPILGWTKLLRTGRLDGTKTEQALETIERNAKLQAQLIEDLLDVSRILQGKMTLNVATVNLEATIEAALETVRLAAEAKHLQIQTTFNPIAGTVSGDANRLQQVVWNLLSNAVKFTPVGGRIEVQLEQVDTYAQIQVKDSGKGISPEFLPYVFDYFRQEDGTTTRKFGGLGLGLAIVRHFTELHGGTIQADSLGQNLGATFTIRLPLNLVEPESSCDDKHPESATDLAGVQVLVVDDDADMRELAAFTLMQSGAQVTTAASAAQALTFLNSSVPDLLLCDIGMPEMDGYALIQQIRKWPPEQGGTIPAIALTAYAGEINQQQALAAGFQMHIAKPVEPEELVKAIAHLLTAGSR